MRSVGQPGIAGRCYAIAVLARIELIARAPTTVERALLEGATVVILVLYLFLRNLRGALVVALTFCLWPRWPRHRRAAGRLVGDFDVLGRFGHLAGNDRRSSHRAGGERGASLA